MKYCLFITFPCWKKMKNEKWKTCAGENLRFRTSLFLSKSKWSDHEFVGYFINSHGSRRKNVGRNRMTCPILAAMWGGSLSLSILFFFQPVDTRLDTLLCCLTYMICMSVLVELKFDNLRFECKICSYIGFFSCSCGSDIFFVK